MTVLPPNQAFRLANPVVGKPDPLAALKKANPNNPQGVAAFAAQTPGVHSFTGSGDNSVPGGAPVTNSGLPSSPNGSSLPFAGVYLEQQNAAQSAYERAQAALLANRNTLYHKYGLTSEGKVDPYSQYGDYQQLLSQEGSALDQSRNDAIGRGIGSGGLARQGESALRFQQAGQNLDFQHQVDQVGSDYASGLEQAGTNRDNAIYQSEADALASAIAQMQATGSWTPVGPGGGDGSSTTTGTGTTTKTKTPIVAPTNMSKIMQLVNPQVKKKVTYPIKKVGME